MIQNIFSASHPLHNLWVIGNSGIVKKKQAKEVSLDKSLFQEDEKSGVFSPRVVGILMKGLSTFLLYNFQETNREIHCLLRKIENPKLPAVEKTCRNLQQNRRLRNEQFKAQNAMFGESESFEDSGNKFRVAGEIKTHHIRRPFSQFPITDIFINKMTLLKSHCLSTAST